MDECDTSYNGVTLMCQIQYDYVKGQKSYCLNTKLCQKPYEGQRRIGIMYIHNTSSYGDRHMCQI